MALTLVGALFTEECLELYWRAPRKDADSMVGHRLTCTREWDQGKPGEAGEMETGTAKLSHLDEGVAPGVHYRYRV